MGASVGASEGLGKTRECLRHVHFQHSMKGPYWLDVTVAHHNVWCVVSVNRYYMYTLAYTYIYTCMHIHVHIYDRACT